MAFKIIPVLLISTALSAQKIGFTHFNDLPDFDKHRVASTSIAWTGTIIGYKSTGKIWKGMLIGFGASMAIGTGKELVYDGAMHRGTKSGKDMAANLLGSAVGTIAGFMCCGLQQHMQDRKEELRQSKFINPLN